MNKIKLLSIVLLSGLFLVWGCKKEEPVTPDPTLEEWKPQTVETKGILSFGTAKDLSKLKIVAGIHQGEVSDSPFQRGFDKYFKIDLNANVVQLITVFEEDKPLMQCIAPTSNSAQANMTIDATATAQSLVFMKPFLCTSNRTHASTVLNTIANCPSFPQLVNEVQLVIEAGAFQDINNTTYTPSLPAVYSQALAVLTQSYQPQNTSGIDLFNIQSNPTNLSFQYKNNRKRWLKPYIEKYAPNSTSPVIQELDMLESYDVKLLEDLFHYVLGNTTPSIESAPISINMNGFEKADIKFYGLGFNNLPPFNLNNVDFQRGLEPMTADAITNFAFPMVEVAIGYDIGVELRGRPMSTITKFRELINGIRSETVGNLAFVSSLVNANTNADKLKVIADGVTEGILSKEKVIIEMATEIVGKKVVLKTALKNAFIAYKAYQLSETVVNLLYSGYALFASDWVTKFTLYGYSPVPTNGLVAYYPFNGSANDESGNGNNGTVNGATLTTDRKGNSNKAYSFDGNTSYISYNIMNMSELSVSIWFNNNDTDFNRYQKLFSFGVESIHVGIQNSYDNTASCQGVINSNVSNNGTIATSCDVAPNYSDGQWHHVVAIYSPVNHFFRIYVDAILKSEGELTAQFNTFNVFDIGRSNSPCCGYFQGTMFNGKLDDARIYNRALSDSEIQALYNE